ncbi:hypothetical protein [Lewinella cohaerens]|uniref:hypothetical protein n=1 Tax=Lewinella cohaerens TaxID=70995 RepID=UPI0003666581|nr:hypothetical protein [Lewinella cohaerens]
MNSTKLFKVVCFFSLFFFATTMIAQDQEIQLGENPSSALSWTYGINFDAQVTQFTTDFLLDLNTSGPDPEGLREFMQAYCYTMPAQDSDKSIVPGYEQYGFQENVGQCVSDKHLIVLDWCVVAGEGVPSAYLFEAKPCTDLKD